MSPCIHPPRPEHFGLPPHGESRLPHDAPVAGGNATVSHEPGIAEAMARLRRVCAGEPAGDVPPPPPYAPLTDPFRRLGGGGSVGGGGHTDNANTRNPIGSPSNDPWPDTRATLRVRLAVAVAIVLMAFAIAVAVLIYAREDTRRRDITGSVAWHEVLGGTLRGPASN